MQDDQKRDDQKQQKSGPPSRRAFLRRALAVSVAGVGGGALLSACGDGGGGGNEAVTCDTSGLTEQEMAQRENFEYVAQTPNPQEYCSNCQFWQPDAVEGECGGCQLFPGPVAPQGWCNSWVQAST